MENTGMQDFHLESSLEILRRTPSVLRALLVGLSPELLAANEGPETWNSLEVVGHLIHGERADWIPRAKHILEGRGDEPFQPFDRHAHLRESAEKDLESLLSEFEGTRLTSLEELEAFGLTDPDLELKGTHPEFGPVTLGQLLATWVTHDLSHLAQIARVLAKHHGKAVGPWSQYLSVLRR